MDEHWESVRDQSNSMSCRVSRFFIVSSATTMAPDVRLAIASDVLAGIKINTFSVNWAARMALRHPRLKTITTISMDRRTDVFHPIDRPIGRIPNLLQSPVCLHRC